MEETMAAGTWQEEVASMVDSGIGYSYGTASYRERESVKEQVTGFMRSWGEMMLDLGKGCKDIFQQTVFTEDSFVVRTVGRPVAEFSGRFKFLNDFLPEDRDPAHAWPVILFVFFLALAVLSVSTSKDSLEPKVKKVRVHPPSANRTMLPDGRNLSYHEYGVPASRARFSIVVPHSFLFSRFAGIPGIKQSLLEDFGVFLVAYDLPGFGESDPHPSRNLNSSAQDMLHVANAVGIDGKFWVLGHSSGSMHVCAALRHIPNRIAGAALFAPLINPYEPSMTRAEMRRTWEHWLTKRKFMYFLARKLPKFLSYFYRQSFLSGNHGRIDKWMSLTLGGKDGIIVEDQRFEELWQRNVEESVRQGSTKPFVEEAVLLVSSWGFSIADLQARKKCQGRGILQWLKSMYSEEECELTGFLGPIHIWQGMDDEVVPPSMTDYISRVLPEVVLHKLPDEGHFSYFFLCDECHKQILYTLFGDALGPVDDKTGGDEIDTSG